jgi:hypothetical protein
MRNWLVCISCGVVLLAGCTSGSKKAQPSATRPTSSSAPSTTTATPSPSPSPKPKPKPQARRVEPLTGVPVRTVARRPVLVVKVENSLAARPQTGIGRADIVAEELVEGGITRFAAMFHSALPHTVGPVRSLRDVDRAIAGPTRGVLVASGAASVVRRRVARGAAQVTLPTDAGRYFVRTSGRPAPHNLYLKPSGVLHVARRGHRTPPRTTYLPFAPTAAQSTAVRYGHTVHRINLRFSPGADPRWTYDQHSHTWLRSEGSTPSRLTSGRRMTARTVLVVRVHTRDAGYRDPAGNFVPKTVFIGRGRAMVFCEGRRISAEWIKKAPRAPLQLRTRYGHKPLLIAPGRTWIEMLPTSGTLGLG